MATNALAARGSVSVAASERTAALNCACMSLSSSSLIAIPLNALFRELNMPLTLSVSRSSASSCVFLMMFWCLLCTFFRNCRLVYESAPASSGRPSAMNWACCLAYSFSYADSAAIFPMSSAIFCCIILNASDDVSSGIYFLIILSRLVSAAAACPSRMSCCVALPDAFSTSKCFCSVSALPRDAMLGAILAPCLNIPIGVAAPSKFNPLPVFSAFSTARKNLRCSCLALMVLLLPRVRAWRRASTSCIAQSAPFENSLRCCLSVMPRA